MKKKINKEKNKVRLESILNQISKNFTVTDKKFGNGYFIFTFGDNTVCHFSLKETPLWKYGIWLDDQKGFTIFGEHEWLIDKFKPSRTYLSFENDIQSFIREVSNINKNPKLYFVDSYTNGDALVAFEKEDLGNGNFDYIGFQCVREFNEEEQLWNKFRRDESISQKDFVEEKWNEYVEMRNQEKADSEFDRKFVFDFFTKLPDMHPNIIAVGIHDRNKNVLCCSPRYDIKILVEQNISEEKLNELYDIIGNFDKNFYEIKKSYDHNISFKGCYNNIVDMKDCDYKYYKS